MRENILRLKDIIERVGLSRSSIYLKVNEGTFPKPIKLSKRAIGWPVSSIDYWIEEQIQNGARENGHE